MKRIILTVIVTLMATVAIAQSEDKRGFEIGVETGLTSLVNSPAISPIWGAPEAYTGVDYHLRIGCRHGANAFALVYGGIPLYTERATHLETSAQFELSLKYRRFLCRWEKLEPYCGASVGAVCTWTGFDYGNDRYENTWWNNRLELETGVMIAISSRSSFDISFGLFSGGLMAHRDINVPSGMQPTERAGFSGYRVALGYSFHLYKQNRE